jgi:hypothetical protein
LSRVPWPKTSINRELNNLILTVAFSRKLAPPIVFATLPFNHQYLVSTGGPIRAKKGIVGYDFPQTFSLSFADFIKDIVMMHLSGSEET